MVEADVGRSETGETDFTPAVSHIPVPGCGIAPFQAGYCSTRTEDLLYAPKTFVVGDQTYFGEER